MAIRKIFHLGNDLLRKKSEIVEFPLSNEDEQLLIDLKDTLHNFIKENGFGRGIAAPQIGVLKRALCLDMTGDNPKFFINPEITYYSDEKIKLFDDCFSMPYIMVNIYRSKKIKVKYFNENGDMYHEEFTGDWAELLQHEIDHLNGILAIDRVKVLSDIWSKAEYLEEFSNS
ncbi:MAG: peptide deformylase [Clostridia bacterium]